MRESNLQRRWVREEVVILVTEYFRTKNLSTKEVNESYYQISEFLRNGWQEKNPKTPWTTSFP